MGGIDVCSHVSGCLSVRCETFRIVTQEKLSLYSGVQFNCKVYVLLCVCL